MASVGYSRSASSLGFSANLGAGRVRTLGLLESDFVPSWGTRDLTRATPSRAAPAGLPPMADIPGSAADDSQFACAARKELRAHVDALQGWVVQQIRTTRRNLRKKSEGGAVDAANPVLPEAWIALLQQVCDERLWRRQETACVAALEGAHSSMAPQQAAPSSPATKMWAMAKNKTLQVLSPPACHLWALRGAGRGVDARREPGWQGGAMRCGRARSLIHRSKKASGLLS